MLRPVFTSNKTSSQHPDICCRPETAPSGKHVSNSPVLVILPRKFDPHWWCLRYATVLCQFGELQA